MVYYPSVEKITEFNLLALSFIRAKKGDSPKLASPGKIENILRECKSSKGDIHDKAVILLTGLVRAHAFESGNRRTAFLATKYFLRKNKARFGLKDSASNAKALLGIREHYYTDQEVKEWLQNGKIRPFKR